MILRLAALLPRDRMGIVETTSRSPSGPCSVSE
jgi:hypothetical protein